MPLRGTPNAPKFDGSTDQLLRYFEDIEQLVDTANLSADDRIKAAIHYIPQGDTLLWQGYVKDAQSDFNKFKNLIMAIYPGCNSASAYTWSDLDFVILEQAGKAMTSQTDLGVYYRDFLRISNVLLEKKRLAENDRDRLFLDGFPEPIKSRVLRCLEIKLPDQDPDNAYTLKQIYDAAHFLLKSGGSLPSTKTASSTPSPSFSRLTYVPPPQTTSTRPAPGVVVKQEYTMRNASQGPPTCYFCGALGHTTKHCPEVFAYEQAGKVTRAQDRRITLADGTWIPQEVGKTMKESVDSLHQELEKRNANVPAHVTTSLLCLLGPEIKTKLDIEPSAYLQTSMDESPAYRRYIPSRPETSSRVAGCGGQVEEAKKSSPV